MARPKGRTPTPVEIPEEQQQALVEADIRQKAGDLALARITEAADVLQAAGRIQAAELYATVSDRLIAETYQKIKETKGYLGLPYKDADGKFATVSGLEEFARVFLGKSARRCQQLSENLHLLGPALYEQAEAVGFKTRDYTALKALPSDDQQAVMAALDSEDKDQALGTLCQLVARHEQARQSAEKAKAKAEKERDERKADYDALGKVVADKETTIQKLQSGDLKPAALDEQMQQWPALAGYLLGEISRQLAQVDLMIETAAQLEKPDEGTPEWDAFLRGMQLLSDSLGPGLVERIDYAQGIYHKLGRDIDVWLGAQEEALEARAQEALDGLPVAGDTIN